MTDLNPQQFYHGTTSPIKDTHVRPAWDVDKDPSEYSMGDPGDMSEGDHAFVSEDEPHAWRIAHTVRVNGMRPRVYATGDNPDKKPGPWNPQHPDWLSHVELDHPDPEYAPTKDQIHEEIVDGSLPEWGSKTGFPIRHRIDIMPGRQGTFPDLNWNRFKEGGHKSQMGWEMNHPSDDQVKYGTKLESHPNDMMVEAMRNEHDNPEPKRRSGRALRAFMMGKPEPPEHLATLFDK